MSLMPVFHLDRMLSKATAASDTDRPMAFFHTSTLAQVTDSCAPCTMCVSNACLSLDADLAARL
jgi:hypothetical protein